MASAARTVEQMNAQFPWVHERLVLARFNTETEVSLSLLTRRFGRWTETQLPESDATAFAMIAAPEAMVDEWSAMLDSDDPMDISEQVESEISQRFAGDVDQWQIRHVLTDKAIEFQAINREREEAMRSRVESMGYRVLAVVPRWTDGMPAPGSLNLADPDMVTSARNERDRFLVLNSILAIGVFLFVLMAALQSTSVVLGNRLVAIEEDIRDHSAVLAQLDEARKQMAADQLGLESIRAFLNEPTPMTRTFQHISELVPPDTWLLALDVKRSGTRHEFSFQAASRRRDAANRMLEAFLRTPLTDSRLVIAERIPERERARFAELSGGESYRFTIEFNQDD